MIRVSIGKYSSWTSFNHEVHGPEYWHLQGTKQQKSELSVLSACKCRTQTSALTVLQYTMFTKISQNHLRSKSACKRAGTKLGFHWTKPGEPHNGATTEPHASLHTFRRREHSDAYTRLTEMHVHLASRETSDGSFTHP